LSASRRRKSEVFGRSGCCSCSCSPPEAVTESTAAEAVRDSRRLDVVGQGMAVELGQARTRETAIEGGSRKRDTKKWVSQLSHFFFRGREEKREGEFSKPLSPE